MITMAVNRDMLTDKALQSSADIEQAIDAQAP